MEEPLDSRQLKAFVILAKTGSYTATAKQLFVTHSAISHSMRALESNVGCRLLSKMNKKVMLTDAGEALLQHAEQILEEMKQARTALTVLNKWGSRRLRIIAEAPLGKLFLTRALAQFHEKFPRMLVKIEFLNCCDAVALLAANRADLVFSEMPPGDGRFEFARLFTDTFHVIVKASHRWAAKGAVATAEFTRAPFILHRSLGESQRLIAEHLVKSGVVLNTVAEMDSLDAIKDFVLQTDALTILPIWAVNRELREDTLVALSLGRKPVEQTWGFTHWRHRPLTHSEASLLELCRKIIASMIEGLADPHTTSQINPSQMRNNQINPS